jgi:hypothetical protein
MHQWAAIPVQFPGSEKVSGCHIVYIKRNGGCTNVDNNGKLNLDIHERIDQALYSGVAALESLRKEVGMDRREFWIGVRNVLKYNIQQTALGLSQYQHVV